MNAIIKRYEKARQALKEACTNKFKLTAHIPADPKRDHDILISESLEDIPKLVNAVKSLAELLEDPVMELVAYHRLTRAEDTLEAVRQSW